MPSISEPFGLTPLEAAGYGTASLISRQSGVAEVLQNCLKADFWDINRMADQIINVLQNPSLKDELTHNVGREYNRLSWHKSAEKLMGLYRHHATAGAAA
jgi:glycosyltransferase involved in cell wall biosynthesis